MRYDPEVLDFTSFILISCIEFVLIGQVISHMWRLVIDKQLSMVLYKLETIHQTLIKLKVVRPMNVKINVKMKWFFIVGVFLNCIGYNIRTVMIIKLNFHQNVQFYVSRVSI